MFTNASVSISFKNGCKPPLKNIMMTGMNRKMRSNKNRVSRKREKKYIHILVNNTYM